MAPQYIRIVATPPGEAPLWVREKWVGLCLPVADGRGSREAYVSGVLSGPRNRFIAFAWRFFGKLSKQSGYAVYVRDAVSELEKTAPEAAAWWRQDTQRLQAAGRKFLFRAPYCELVEPEREAGSQSALPVSNTNVEAPSGWLPQIPMRRATVSISFHRSPFTPALILASVLFGGFWNWSHPVRPERQALVHGSIVDWTVNTSYNSRSYPHRTVHLRITGYSEEFRIDPGIFHDLMGNRLPAGFTKGAAIDITADAAQLAAPTHPLLKPGVAIVWVNGLVVNGVTALALRDVIQHERGQWIWWFVLTAMTMVYLGYTIMNSRKQYAGA
jgi:hypothetical protein